MEKFNTMLANMAAKLIADGVTTDEELDERASDWFGSELKSKIVEHLNGTAYDLPRPSEVASMNGYDWSRWFMKRYADYDDAILTENRYDESPYPEKRVSRHYEDKVYIVRLHRGTGIEQALEMLTARTLAPATYGAALLHGPAVYGHDAHVPGGRRTYCLRDAQKVPGKEGAWRVLSLWAELMPEDRRRDTLGSSDMRSYDCFARYEEIGPEGLPAGSYLVCRPGR